MGFDCTTALGRKNVAYVFKNRRMGYKFDWRLIFEDTFMPIVCKFTGHNPYYTMNNGTACQRCHKYL